MSDQLLMFGDATLPDSPNATSSPALESGVTRCDAPDGQMTEKSGPGVAPAPDSRARAKGEGSTTLVISGRNYRGLFANADRLLYSESKSQTQLNSAG